MGLPDYRGYRPSQVIGLLELSDVESKLIDKLEAAVNMLAKGMNE